MKDEPDAVCESCTTDWADDSCSVCGKPICRDCYRTCVECGSLGCPDCMTGIEIADGLIEDACPAHVAKVRESIGCLDVHPDLPRVEPNPCSDMCDGIGFLAVWPDGRWWWRCSAAAAVTQAIAWFTEERKAA